MRSSKLLINDTNFSYSGLYQLINDLRAHELAPNLIASSRKTSFGVGKFLFLIIYSGSFDRPN